MPDALLGFLRLCLLALLYLFFVRVVWAVWAELRGPRVKRPAPTAGPSPAPRQPRSKGRAARGQAQGVLVVTQPAEARGTRFEVADESTVGRGSGCQVHLDDTFASQLHARVFRRDGGLYLEDLGSTNGTFVNGARVTTAVPLHPGDHVQVGQTVLEVR